MCEKATDIKRMPKYKERFFWSMKPKEMNRDLTKPIKQPTL